MKSATSTATSSLLLGLSLATNACSGTDETDSDSTVLDPALEGPVPAVLSAEQCDETRRPIVFVHGGFGGGDNFELQAQRFTSNGYCRDWIFAHDYDSVGIQFAPDGAQQAAANILNLDAAVDAVVAKTGFAQVDLVGHSLGTNVSSTYLSDPAHAAKVAHYASAGGGGPAQPVPSINLASTGDLVAGLSVVPGAENPNMGLLDHMAILTDSSAFAEMYRFFNGIEPEHLDVVPEDSIEVSGFFKNFADNGPRTGVTVEVYAVDETTGQRLSAEPDHELDPAPNGAFGPFAAEPGQHYEFLLPGAGEGGRPLHMYRAPFVRSTHLMYLKAMPAPGSIPAGLISGMVTYTDTRTDMIVQHNHRAMVAGVHTLTLDGTELLTEAVAPGSRTAIAIFAVDEGGDDQTTVAPLSRFASLPIPFLTGADVALSSTAPGPVEVALDSQVIHVPRWKGDSEGTTLVLFDN